MRNLQRTTRARPALALLALVTGTIQAVAQGLSAPQLVNYQGKLTDAAGQPLSNGTYGVAFKIWSTLTGTATNSLVWAHEYDVPLVNGSFNVILGADAGRVIPGALATNISSAFSSADRFLGLTIIRDKTGQPISNPQEIAPRQRILSTPFAFAAGNGIPVGGIIPWLPPVVPTTLAEAEAMVPPGFLLCRGHYTDDDLTIPFDKTLIPDFTGDLFFTGGTPDVAGTEVGSATHTHSYEGPTQQGSRNTEVPANPGQWIPTPNHTHTISFTTQPATCTPKYFTVLFIIRVY